MSQAEKYAPWIKWGLVLVAIGLLAPFLLLVLKGVVALVAAILISVAAIELAPAVSMWLSVQSLKIFTSVVRKNPVEARRKLEGKKADQIQKADAAIAKFNGKVQSYENSIEALCNRSPKDAVKFQKHLAAMKEMLRLKYLALANSRTALEQFKHETITVQMIWDASKAAESVEEASGLLGAGDVYDRIAAEESVRAADEAMANSFALLDHALKTQSVDDLSGLQKALPMVERVDPVVEIPALVGHAKTPQRLS